MGEHPRLILPGFLSEDLCKELQFIHKSCSTVGYRPNVFSTTLSHLIATDCGHLIMPFVAIRERLKEKVEEFFGCEFELFIEFTGLISWTSGAKIGWHSDDNRPYLKQRDFAAVCYLNSYGKDFIGGLFHFLEGVPQTIVPMAGDAIIYTADSRNIHCVDEITNGERCTLTLWFTRDSFHCEDDKLVSLLSQRLLSHQDNTPDLLLPSPAPNNMYWFSLDSASSHLQLGFDIRWARIHILGYDFCSDNDIYDSVSDTEDDPLELLNKPLRLVRGDKIFEKEFDNSLHALQVVQFYQWKGSELDDSERLPQTSNGVRFSYTLSGQKPIISADHKIEDMVLARLVYGFREHHFNWVGFSASIGRYNDYVCSLHRDSLLRFYPDGDITERSFRVYHRRRRHTGAHTAPYLDDIYMEPLPHSVPHLLRILKTSEDFDWLPSEGTGLSDQASFPGPNSTPRATQRQHTSRHYQQHFCSFCSYEAKFIQTRHFCWKENWFVRKTLRPILASPDSFDERWVVQMT